MNLNPEQLAAVQTRHPRVAVIAGAGTGKTATLVSRIADLIKSGRSPDRILALTFTNKAAREMRERLTGMVGDRAARVNVGTFHAMAIRWIRRFLPLTREVPLTKRFNVLDQFDSDTLLDEVRAELAPDLTMRKLRFYRVSREESVEPGHPNRNDSWFRCWKEYHRRLLSADSLDFAGILEMFWYMIKKNPEIAKRQAERFSDVLIDEFQDTSKFQWGLVRGLFDFASDLDVAIFIVGDTRQSLYSWRGAAPDILDSIVSSGSFEVHSLVRNYRSTVPIVTAANRLEASMLIQLPAGSSLVTEKPGPPVEVIASRSPWDEAEYVAGEIATLLDSGASASDVAVIARTHDELRLVGKILKKRKIEFFHVGGSAEIWDRKCTRGIIRMLRLAANHADRQSWNLIANWPYKRFSAGDLARIDLAALQQDRYQVEVGSGYPVAADLASWLEQADENTYLEDALDTVAQVFKLDGPEHEAAVEAIVRWSADQDSSPTIREFLDWFGVRHMQDEITAKDVLLLLTVHGAKGLEWPIVFVIGMSNGRFPLARKGQNFEEEKRLAYVAVTRARDELILSSTALKRLRSGKSVPCSPSAFLGTMFPEAAVAPAAEADQAVSA